MLDSQALSLNPNPVVELFEITLVNGQGVFRFAPKEDTLFQGENFEQYIISIEGVGTNAVGENIRPTLTVLNPLGGMLTSKVKDGLLENARVQRYLIVEVADSTFQQISVYTWYVSQIKTINRQYIVLELRTASDYPSCQLPPNRYYPPEYPRVIL